MALTSHQYLAFNRANIREKKLELLLDNIITPKQVNLVYDEELSIRSIVTQIVDLVDQQLKPLCRRSSDPQRRTRIQDLVKLDRAKLVCTSDDFRTGQRKVSCDGNSNRFSL